MIRWLRAYAWALVATTLVSVTLACGCRTESSTSAQVKPASPPPVTFRDVTEEAGIRFASQNGAAGKKYLPETMGSGCAFLDYDGDGWQDILLLTGMPWEATKRPSITMRLYRNDRNGHFTDVTAETGLSVELYGMGVAVGDYDGDGWDDIYVTGLGASRLFHNTDAFAGLPAKDRKGPPRRFFRDVTAEAGVASPGWATSATWLDYDRDGRLDLFVCHYVQWSQQTDRPYSIDGVRRSYSTPEQYPGESCRLYHNEGAGRFKDVTQTAGILNTRSKALGVVAFDFDQDGWQDILVANDTEPNFLFHNQSNGTFKEVALETGVAVSETGRAKAGMGVDVGDDRGDGQDSILITNFSGEQLTLYRKETTGHYVDEAARSGIGNATQLYLGFGALFFDYDGDGWQDVFVANGHIQGDIDVRATGVVYREPALLLRNLGRGQFMNVTASSGTALQSPQIGRGAAWGDYDNDGRPDLLLSTNAGDPTAGREPADGQAHLLHNENRTGNGWLRLRLEGVRSNRNAYGARVRMRTGTLEQTQTVKCATSYLSQSDRRLLFGLGSAKQADAIEIQWPDGQVQTLGPTPANQSLHIREGQPAVPASGVME